MKKLVSIICVIIVLAGMTTPVYAAKKDTKAPIITKVDPEDKATDIMIESGIVIRFSETILKGKGIDKISVKAITSKSISYTYEIKDNLLIITPKADLKYNTEYTVSIPASAVKDAAGNNLKAADTLSFITEEDPTKKTESVTTGTKYSIGIEAVLEGEFTEAMQLYMVQYLKMLGIDAKITKVEVLNED